MILDDVQQLFKKKEYEVLQTTIINSILVPIRDNNEAAIFLLTSDYSIQEDLSVLSGMSTRVKAFPFPKIGEKEFELAMQKDLENLQRFNNKITLEILVKFYADFNTDLRSLNEFISSYDGNYESK